jgi:hypothetical protein
MIQVLSRGPFCPKDAVASTQIITISSDNILEINEFRALVGAHGTFLSTPVARS